MSEFFKKNKKLIIACAIITLLIIVLSIVLPIVLPMLITTTVAPTTTTVAPTTTTVVKLMKDSIPNRRESFAMEKFTYPPSSTGIHVLFCDDTDNHDKNRNLLHNILDSLTQNLPYVPNGVTGTYVVDPNSFYNAFQPNQTISVKSYNVDSGTFTTDSVDPLYFVQNKALKIKTILTNLENSYTNVNYRHFFAVWGMGGGVGDIFGILSNAKTTTIANYDFVNLYAILSLILVAHINSLFGSTFFEYSALNNLIYTKDISLFMDISRLPQPLPQPLTDLFNYLHQTPVTPDSFVKKFADTFPKSQIFSSAQIEINFNQDPTYSQIFNNDDPVNKNACSLKTDFSKSPY
jgi:hypothetical protein